MSLITPDFGLIFWQTVTLLTVLLILGKFAWRPILNAIQERERNIEEALQAAEVAKDMVARVQADQEALIRTTHQERAKIIEAAKATQQLILDEARAEAEQVRNKMIEQTKERLAKEQEAALEILKNTIATLAIQIAEKLLQNELQQKDAQEEFLQQLIRDTHWG
ncbi:MAG: F0F1 ATP synthase subunit B [Bacteroidota bacterium]